MVVRRWPVVCGALLLPLAGCGSGGDASPLQDGEQPTRPEGVAATVPATVMEAETTVPRTFAFAVATTTPTAVVPIATHPVVATTVMAAPSSAGIPPIDTAEHTTAPPAAAPTAAPSGFDPAGTPPLPGITPISGAGSPQLLSEPLPSGVSWVDAATSLGIAQRLADALAKGDWATARQLDAGEDLTDDAYGSGYGALDRASLMLVDARPEGGGYRLLLVSVANERNGTQTTLYCLEWTVDPAAQLVRQHRGVVGQIGRVPTAVSPEGVRNDPALDSLVRTACSWG